MPVTYIELEGKKVSNRKRKIVKVLKIIGIFLLIIIIIGGILTAYFYPKTKVLASDFEKVSTQTESLKKAVENQDIVKAKDEIKNLRRSLEKTQSDLEKIKLAGKIPLLSGYYNDLSHGLKAAVLGTKAGEMVADSVLPFGDILGLKGVKSDTKADKKVEILVTNVFPSLSAKAGDLEKILKEIKTEIDYIQPYRYPKSFEIKGIKINHELKNSKNLLNQVEAYIPQLKEFLEVLPSVFGYQEEKTYLIWFQNDKELRPTGGFITAYGIAKVKNGKLLSVDSDNIYELDKRFLPYEPPHPIFRKYLFLQIFALRDANISPDYKISSEKFETFYNRIKGMPRVDGVIAMDTELVREFLEVTGPVKTKEYKETFSAELNKKYGIPDVVYKLELYAEKLLSGQRERKGLIGDLMDSMLEKLFSAPPEKFPTILETFKTAAEGKHILFYFHNEKAQKLAEQLNYAGRIKDYQGDYLHINNANVGGLKGNLYTKASVEQDIAIQEDGTVTKKVTVKIRNTGKADGWLNSVYQNWMRVYVPKGSKLVEKKIYTDFAENEDLGKRVWESFSRTRPLQETTTSFTYELPFKVKKGDTYKLMIQKQGGTTDPDMIIRLNGRVINEFHLEKDTVVEFKV